MSDILIYIDESGCLGFKKPRASKYFIITLLKIDSIETQRSIFSAIKKTTKNKISTQKRKTYYELKGSKTDLNVKKYFLNHMPRSGWSLYSAILNKEKIHEHLQTNEGKKRLYNYLAKYLLQHVTFNEDISRIDLYIDKCKNTKEIKEFNIYIEIHLNLSPKTLLNINHVLSHENPVIQAVDLFCWGMFRKYSVHETEWYDCFNKYIKVESVFRPYQKEMGEPHNTRTLKLKPNLWKGAQKEC